MRHIPGPGHRQPGTDRACTDAHQAHAPRPSGQDLCDALGQRQSEPSLRQPRWQTYRLGQSHHKQGARDPTPFLMGDDVRVRPVGQLRGLRRPGQHLQHLQSEDARGQRARVSRTARPHRLPQLLPLPRRQPDRHQLR